MIFSSAVMCLALNIYWEARDQPLAGQIAVAQVVVNRTNDTRYPDNVCEVVYEADYSSEDDDAPIKHRCQFSWFCDDISDDVTDEKAFTWSVRVSRAVLDGKTPDLTEMATHYHKVEKTPSWSYYYKRTIRIEDRIFYKRGR